MFASASVIVVPHGALMANIAFCFAGSRVIELRTSPGYRDFYLQLAAAAELTYEVFEAQPRVNIGVPHHAVESDDMFVDPAYLRRILALP
jgi:capsular polysaccharide biosynthesis protein